MSRLAKRSARLEVAFVSADSRSIGVPYLDTAERRQRPLLLKPAAAAAFKDVLGHNG
jgi:hypothetical protein